MTFPLLSPGVDITVDDETFYASAGAGTIPLIIIGTHEFKAAPGTTGIAPGTLPENANTLYPISSQRELIQTFGNPVFYTQDGTPLHGYELNEYGLHAAYQYLGIANQAYVIRGSIDYSQLLPRTVPPTGEPINGTYWLDLTNTVWGIFQSNGSPVPGTAWASETPIIINNVNDLDNVILGTVGVSDPIVAALISASGHLNINGTQIPVNIGDAMQTVVNAINSANINGVIASFFNLRGLSYLQLRNINAAALVVNNTSTPSVLVDLGLTNAGPAALLPKATVGLDGDYAVIVSSNDNVIYEKLTPEAAFGPDPLAMSFWFVVGSKNWNLAQPTRITGSSAPATVVTSDILNISADGTTILAVPMTGVASVVDVATAINTAVTGLPAGNANKVIASSVIGGALVITNTVGGNITLTSSGTVIQVLGLASFAKGNQVYYAPHFQIPANSSTGDVWIKTTNPNAGANYVLKLYDATNVVFNTITVPFYATDAAASLAFGANIAVGSIYVQYNLYGTTTLPVASSMLRRWNGVNWSALAYQASTTAPTTAPEAGALWFNNDLQVDIMYGTGQQWIGYRNAPANVGTDPVGVIIDGSMPTQQSAGGALAQNDIWLDSSDTENYPKLYRYQFQTQSWTLLDLTDDTTSFGIIFRDARPNADGTQNGPIDAASMLSSDFVDPDAPNPQLFPAGMLLFNTRYSTNNVKAWHPTYLSGEFETTDWTQAPYNVGNTVGLTVTYPGRWVTASGNKSTGAPYMGRKAQRQIIVTALAATIVANEQIRAETVFFNLIAAPGYVELISDMVSLNVDKKQVAFVVGDVPARLDPSSTSITNWSQGTNPGVVADSEEGLVTADPYLGIYYPWGMSTNTDGTQIMIPSSTIGLFTIAYSDSVSYQWFAPAGYTRGLVTNATTVGYLNVGGNFVPTFLNQGQRDILYTNNINPIAYIPNRGLVVYGQKTRNPTTTALDRINVARLVNYLRFNLDLLAKPFLFEPNDQHTQDSVQTSFSRFLGDLVGLRGIFDYIVVCDSSNNTPDRVDRNELWIDIALSPEKAIEFIYIPLRLVNTGTDLSTLFNPASATA